MVFKEKDEKDEEIDDVALEEAQDDEEEKV